MRAGPKEGAGQTGWNSTSLRAPGCRAGLVPCAIGISPDSNTGGERGIRTPDTRKGIHAFEARAFSHSAISPRSRVSS